VKPTNIGAISREACIATASRARSKSSATTMPATRTSGRRSCPGAPGSDGNTSQTARRHSPFLASPQTSTRTWKQMARPLILACSEKRVPHLDSPQFCLRKICETNYLDKLSRILWAFLARVVADTWPHPGSHLIRRRVDPRWLHRQQAPQ